MIVSVVAGGWSFREVNHYKIPGHVIAVNDAAVWLLSRPNEVLSMDRLWTEKRWEKLEELCVRTNIRREALKNVPWQNRPWCGAFDCDINSSQFTFETIPPRYNGGNSGQCAVARAYVLRPSTLYLFGFDMCRGPRDEAYWYPPYPWARAQGTAGKDGWVRQLNAAAQQFKDMGTDVVNVSLTSRVTAFRKVSAKELGIAA